jgi:integrative and conjugative element protein (TIGR02256 family)
VTTCTTGILITRTGLDDADHAGRAALPVETGGLLLGFRADGLIVVTRTLVVVDPGGSRRSYLRHRRRAQALLAERRSQLPSVVGYVGEWHTHPADQGPSGTDLGALREVGGLTAGPVGLLVLSYPASGEVRLHGALGVRRRPRRRLRAGNAVDVRNAEIRVTDDPAETVEVEAAEAYGRNPTS